MSQLFEIEIKLTENQRNKLRIAYNEGKTVIIRLPKNSLNGDDILHVLEGTKLHLEECREKYKGLDIKVFSIEDIIINEEGQFMLTY